MSRKKLWAFVGAGMALLIAGGALTYWYTQVKVPHQEAVGEYQAASLEYAGAADELESLNSALRTKISDLEGLANGDESPLDPDLLTESGAVIGHAQAVIVDVTPMPATLEEVESSSIEEVHAFTTELRTITESLASVEPYDKESQELEDALERLRQSIAQMALVTHPSEQFVIERLTGLPNIVGVQAATEDHDPNGQLNKQGGYTAAVFFSSDLVDRSMLYEVGDIVETGTDGGGSVEVYETVELAETRDAYLASFDGTMFSSGSHFVVGTTIVRVSSHLTASQQQTLQDAIVQSLTSLD